MHAQEQDEPLGQVITDYLAQTDATDVAKMRQRLERYASWLRNSLSPDRPPTMTDVTTSSVERFLSALVDGRTAGTKAPTRAKGSTVNRYRAVIGGLCTYAVAVDRMASHPVSGKKVRKRPEPMHRLPELSADEYRDYVELVRRQMPKLVIVFLLLIHTAPDVGELFERELRDVDFEQRRIRYQRTKTQRYQTTNRPRFVPMPAVVLEELRGHVAEHRLRGSMPLFSMIDRHDVELIHRRAARAIARPELTLKDLRHVAAISWVRAGVHIRIVQKWLGHGSLSQTARYTDYEPESDETAALIDRAADTLNQSAGVIPIAEAHDVHDRHQLPLQLMTGTGR